MSSPPNYHAVPPVARAAAAVWSAAIVAGIVSAVRHGTTWPLLLTVTLSLLALPVFRRCLSRAPRIRWRDRELLEGFVVTSEDGRARGYRESSGGRGGPSLRVDIRAGREAPSGALLLGSSCVLLVDSIMAYEASAENAALAVMGLAAAALAVLAAFLTRGRGQRLVVWPVDRVISGPHGEVLVPPGAQVGVYRHKAGKHVRQMLEVVQPRARICALGDRERAVHLAELVVAMIDGVKLAGAYRYEVARTGQSIEAIRIPLE